MKFKSIMHIPVPAVLGLTSLALLLATTQVVVAGGKVTNSRFQSVSTSDANAVLATDTVVGAFAAVDAETTFSTSGNTHTVTIPKNSFNHLHIYPPKNQTDSSHTEIRVKETRCEDKAKDPRSNQKPRK